MAMTLTFGILNVTDKHPQSSPKESHPILWLNTTSAKLLNLVRTRCFEEADMDSLGMEKHTQRRGTGTGSEPACCSHGGC
jgi:hypothetical protein